MTKDKQAIDEAELRLKCVDIAFNNTRHNISETDYVLANADKIFQYVKGGKQNDR